MSGELSPCPFCGGACAATSGHSLAELPWSEDGGAFHRVYCSKCQSRQLFHRTKAEAIEAWNRRASPPPQATGAPVDVERIMALAEQYARAHTLDERVTFEHMGTAAEEAAEKAMNAARETLRASLVAHKAGNVSDNGTSDQSVSHNVRAAATMAQTKETP